MTFQLLILVILGGYSGFVKEIYAFPTDTSSSSPNANQTEIPLATVTSLILNRRKLTAQSNYNPCYPNFYYSGKCYFLTASSTYASAASQCQSNGGYLATITSVEMNTVIVSMFGSSSNYWIGYARVTNCGNFYWQDGSTSTYTRWASNQPDCARNIENCGSINYSPGYWNDWPCSNTYQGICSITIGSLPTYNPCYPNFYYSGKCYFLTSILPYTSAVGQCQSKGGYLTTITSVDMNTVIVSMFGSNINYWIGYVRATTPCGNFYWQDGSTSTYTRWASNQPDCARNIENCGSINYSPGYWNDWPCSNTYQGICSSTTQEYAMCDLAAALTPATVGQSGWTCAKSINICISGVSTWAGVSCSNNDVTSISLPGLALTGSLPDSIGALSMLTKLDFSYNSIAGTLPSGITNLVNLQYLDISYNSLNGLLPLDIGSTMSSLQYLSVSGNSFSGRVPYSLCLESRLSYLYFESNKFICYFPCLSTVANKKYGSIPSSCTVAPTYSPTVSPSVIPTASPSFSYASKQDYTMCDLAAALSPGSHGRSGWTCFGYTPTVTICSGTTSTWGGVTCSNSRVVLISLVNLKLAGTIPTSIGLISYLTYLDIRSNSITGTLPTTLGLLNQMAILRLDSNSFSGSLPTSLCSALALALLSFSGNSMDCYAVCLSSVSSLSTGTMSTCTPVPSIQPTMRPTVSPILPSNDPTLIPTSGPSTSLPSRNPTFTYSVFPTTIPSVVPSAQPIFHSSLRPTVSPILPSNDPTLIPTSGPSTSLPSRNPTFTYSVFPTTIPSVVPSAQPTIVTSPFVVTSAPTTILTTTLSSPPTFISHVVTTAFPAAEPSSIPAPSIQPTAVRTSLPTNRIHSIDPKESNFPKGMFIIICVIVPAFSCFVCGLLMCWKSNKRNFSHPNSNTNDHEAPLEVSVEILPQGAKWGDMLEGRKLTIMSHEILK